ncbi:discoidin domain-containing protein [Ruania alkalisoli]|uniref:Discoidin domain-containing protein n=1 Tax=Ruania alkalisoli TaxID=2779775 RepID=A0A7M1ST84_9MICO|nr:discoidin domain-containing protein [Ruania alkalisoli]QOR69823.1 discoidin domain-containing protein [Ruania alkalisoli]
MSTRRSRTVAPVVLMAGLALLAGGVPAVGASEEGSYSIDEVGAPISAVNIRTAAMGAMPDGTPVVYAPTYGEPARLSVVQGETGELISVHDLGDKTTSNYTGLSPDGSAYAAGQTPGANLFRYDPATDDVTDLGAPVSGESNISRLTSFADDGTLYSGTYPSGHVFSYHPDRGFQDFGPIAEGEQYARSTAFDGEGTLYVGTGTNARLFELNVTTGARTEIALPAEYAGQQTYVNEMYYRDGLLFAFLSPAYAYVVYDTVAGEWRDSLTDVQASPITDVVDGTVYYVNRTPNDVFSYDLTSGETAQVTDLNQISLNSARGFGVLRLQDPEWPGSTIAGMGLTGRMWHYNIDTAEFRWVQTQASAGALKIAALGMGSDDNLYAAGYLTPGVMARIDVETLESEALAGPSQSQFIGTVDVEGGAPAMFIGGYSDAGVWRYDHTAEWSYPYNPIRLARLDSYDQERVLAMVGVGEHLAVTTLGPKGSMGGHLTILDPVTGSIRYSAEPVPGHAVASLHYEEIDGREVIVGGTTSNQLGVEHPDPEARFFIFDLETLTTDFVTMPRSGVTSISQILELPDERIWAFANDATILELDIERDGAGSYSIRTTEVASIFGEPRSAGQWAGSRLSMLDPDTVLGNAAGSVYTIDVATQEVEIVTEGNEATATGDGRFFFVRDTVVFRGTPEGWIAPDPDPEPEPTDPTTNYALADNGASAAASSTYGAYGPGQVIDGDTTSVTSRWISAADDVDPWLEIVFAEEAVVDTVSLYQYLNYELADYDISAQVDGDWVTVAEIRGNVAARTVHEFSAVSATALRLDGIASSDGRVRLFEVEVTCQASADCAGGEEPEAAPVTTAHYVGNNWVTVALSAEDGGSGIGGLEYRFDDGDWFSYTEPFSLKRSDRQLLEYRGTSPDGTAEETRCIAFEPGGGRVDVTVSPDYATCTN